MYVCEQQQTFVSQRVKRVEQPWLELTVKHLVPGDEGHPHTLAAVFHQVLKVQFALLDEVLLHLRRAAGVSLRTEAQVLTCGRRRTYRISFTAGGLACLMSMVQTLPTHPTEGDQGGTNRKENSCII